MINENIPLKNKQNLISKLPPVNSNVKGWPWTEESDSLPDKIPNGNEWPRITIVTPSFNQGQYLEETIRSVLLQNYPNLEYFIMDGGSTDHSIDIIKKYEPWIDWWVSEPDGGQSNAINKGFSKATGLYLNWMNSDDFLTKNALRTLVLNMELNNDNIVYLGDYYEQFENSKSVRKQSDIRTLQRLVDIGDSWRGNGGNQIGQQATFFPKQLFELAGGVNAANYFTMDYELWGRFLINGAKFVPINKPLGVFRIIEGQKTAFRHKQTLNLIDASKRLVNDSHFSPEEKKAMNKKISCYKRKFLYGEFRSWMGIRRRLGLRR